MPRRGVIYMLQLLYYFVAWPFILIGAGVDFLVWDLFLDGRGRQRQEPSNPAKAWMDEALTTQCRVRELEDRLRREQGKKKEREK